MENKNKIKQKEKILTYAEKLNKSNKIHYDIKQKTY